MIAANIWHGQICCGFGVCTRAFIAFFSPLLWRWWNNSFSGGFQLTDLWVEDNTYTHTHTHWDRDKVMINYHRTKEDIARFFFKKPHKNIKNRFFFWVNAPGPDTKNAYSSIFYMGISCCKIFQKRTEKTCNYFCDRKLFAK